MEQVETTSPPTEPNDVERWAGVIAGLEARSAALATRRNELESERRGLLAEKAAGNSTVEERLRELRTELAEIEREAEEVRLALPEAGRRLVAARENQKAATIFTMTEMLHVLETERDQAIAKARTSDKPQDLERAYVKHRQCFGLRNDLHTLTHDSRFAGFWNLAPFGMDLQYAVGHVHLRAKQGMVPIPKPWGELFTIATTN